MTKTIKKNPVYKKGVVYHPEWIHTDYMNFWITNFTSDGSLLNVCSGASMLGQVRIDLDPESNRTNHGDLFKIQELFKPNSFDYVYCDPDFKYYTTGENRFRWQFELFKLCKIALITRRPKVTVNMPSKWHDYIILEDSRPSFDILRIDYK